QNGQPTGGWPLFLLIQVMHLLVESKYLNAQGRTYTTDWSSGDTILVHSGSKNTRFTLRLSGYFFKPFVKPISCTIYV
ncbi:MAG: hypothetical protein RQ936_11745, partial [Gammaproteobacteria bacterium]|nr:hypothetical protein [Gammaproteobacteria bacterium]